jgi:hypothetical protein
MQLIDVYNHPRCSQTCTAVDVHNHPRCSQTCTAVNVRLDPRVLEHVPLQVALDGSAVIAHAAGKRLLARVSTLVLREVHLRRNVGVWLEERMRVSWRARHCSGWK